MAPTLPIFVGVCWLGGAWFTAGACVPLIAWPMLAQFVHPHLHRRYDDVSRGDRASSKIRNGPGSEWVEEAAAEGPFRLNEGVEQAVTVDGRLGEEAVGRGPTPEASRDEALRRWVDEVAKKEKTP
jgi:hypothetical protein